MEALVLCGGQGTRLESDVEKPLLPVRGRAMVDRVLDALVESDVDRVTAVTSPHTPATRDHLDARGVTTVEGTGKGYVTDLADALEPREPPVLTVVADLPLLAPEHVDCELDAYDGRDRTVCVPTALKEALKVSADTTREHGGRELAPTGLNVVGETNEEAIAVRWDARLAVNVNRRADAEVAEVLADEP